MRSLSFLGRFHLSTALAAAFVAGLLMWANFEPYEYHLADDRYADRTLYSILPGECKGWPWPWYRQIRVTRESLIKDGMDSKTIDLILDLEPQIRWNLVAFNILYAGGLVIVFAALMEYVLRRWR